MFVSHLNHDILYIIQIYSFHKYAYPFSVFLSWIVLQNEVPHFRWTYFDVRSIERIYKRWKSANLRIDVCEGDHRTGTIYRMPFYKCNQMAVYVIKNSKCAPHFFFKVSIPCLAWQICQCLKAGPIKKGCQLPVPLLSHRLRNSLFWLTAFQIQGYCFRCVLIIHAGIGSSNFRCQTNHIYSFLAYFTSLANST